MHTECNYDSDAGAVAAAAKKKRAGVQKPVKRL